MHGSVVDHGLRCLHPAQSTDEVELAARRTARPSGRAARSPGWTIY